MKPVTVILLILIVGMLACGGDSEITPSPVPESTIPSHFTTYTEEGFCSVSYPSDWDHGFSGCYTVEADGGVISVMGLLFEGGLPTDGEYRQAVVIDEYDGSINIEEQRRDFIDAYNPFIITLKEYIISL